MGEEKSGRNVGGRPTKYDPAFCERVIEEMGKGYSFTAFCGAIGIAKDTGYNWVKQHNGFSDAVKIGRSMRLKCLETKLLEADMGPRVTAMIFALKNADREEWADKTTTELTGKDGGPVATVSMTKDEFAVVAKKIASEV